MKSGIIAAVLSMASMTLSGCTYVANDLRHPGGAVGAVMDHRIFDASGSKELVLLRAAIIAAMVARAGTVYARDDDDAEAYVNYLAGTADELNILAGHLYVGEGPSGKGMLACEVPPAVLAAAKERPGPDALKPIALQEAVKRAEAAQARAASWAYRAEQSGNQAEQSSKRAQAILDQVEAWGEGKISPGAGQDAERQNTKQNAKEVSPPRVMAVGDAGAEGKKCLSYAVNFESDLPIYERRLFRLAMAALPQQQAKRFLDQVTEGDLLGAAVAAFHFSVKALDGLHSGAAVHRTGLEIIALNSKKGDEACQDARKRDATVSDAASCLGLPPDQLFVGKQDKPDEYEKKVNPAAFHALMMNMRDSCLMVPLANAAADMEKEDFETRRDARLKVCNRIKFEPRSRWWKPGGG